MRTRPTVGAAGTLASTTGDDEASGGTADAGKRRDETERVMSVLRSLAKAAFAAGDIGRRRRPGPRLLIYHQVGTDLGRQMEVPLDRFLAQLDLLRREGSIVPLDTALARIGEPGDDRLFVLTFDDGYADVYHNAFPHLVERQIPFTLYLTTDPIERRAESFGHPGAVPLTWDQVADMAGSGLATIGAHTHTHPDLRHLDEETIVAELDRSNELIEDRTGVAPRHFAYPKGWWAPRAEAPIAARYDTAALGEGPPITPATNPYRLHRVAIQRADTMAFFARKLATGMVWEERVRRRLRGYDGPPD